MKLLYTSIVFLMFSAASVAQFTTNNKRMADVYFHNQEYFAAAEYYKRSLQISADSSGFVVPYGFESRMKDDASNQGDYEYSVFRLAESLRLYKNFTDAEGWYALAKNFKNPKYATAPYWYAVCLRANQKYEQAIKAFDAFIAAYRQNDQFKERAKTEISSCRFALYELRYPRMFRLSRLTNDINEKGSNYTPLMHQGVFYFTSSRPQGGSGKTEVLTGAENTRVAKKETPFLNAIYEVKDNPVNTSIRISKVTGGRQRESAAPAFVPDGNVMFCTSWTGKGEKIITKQKRSAAGEWSDPVDAGIQVNIRGYNAIQPFVTTDGKYLIFSSDRPGGLGGYDLWYCPLRPDGQIGQAINMGNVINTSEDDQAPYYSSVSKKLIYSSKGRVGMGGFDFFESTGDFSRWTTPENLGYPFNSSKDDMYFSPAGHDETEGYISSDRESLCCLEIFKIRREYLNVKGTVFDCNTNKPLGMVKVTLVDSAGSQVMTTGDDGTYTFKVSSNRKLRLTAEKDRYFTKALVYTYDELANKDTLFSPELCLTPFEVDKPIVLKDVFYEFDEAALTEDSKRKLDHLYSIMIDNPNIEIELGAHTDSKGPDIYNLDLSQRRARSCVDYLVSKGISASRMTSKGYGETRPVAPNTLANGKDNPAGRALNRRTEFKVTRK
ncbi:OmpA family protein [Pedobacter deserti]|uniref:OmpA family protein n=1 Tax=Pedobacter deserti TaxID=2817382 RepID=UPI00210B3F75|nr:OmpA family protein [Pedobacter sp. SYSU D00382]